MYSVIPYCWGRFHSAAPRLLHDLELALEPAFVSAFLNAFTVPKYLFLLLIRQPDYVLRHWPLHLITLLSTLPLNMKTIACTPASSPTASKFIWCFVKPCSYIPGPSCSNLSLLRHPVSPSLHSTYIANNSPPCNQIIQQVTLIRT